MKDLSYDEGNSAFQVRVGCIIRKDDKILIQKESSVDYVSLPGGRVKLMEDAISAGIREIKEELGVKATFKKEIAIIENFFTLAYNNKQYHEILMLIEFTLDDKSFYEKEVVENLEEDKNIELLWLDKEGLKEYHIKPDILTDFNFDDEFKHYVLK